MRIQLETRIDGDEITRILYADGMEILRSTYPDDEESEKDFEYEMVEAMEMAGLTQDEQDDALAQL